MTALALPETNISIIFLPMFHFPITFGFAGMIGLDILGIVRRWQYVFLQHLTWVHQPRCDAFTSINTLVLIGHLITGRILEVAWQG
jgi:hypothetical protein